MLDQQIIDELKRRYENDVYFVPIGKQEYVFRSLTFAEYKQFNNLGLSIADLEEHIILNAVVYPYPLDLDKMKPGTISALSDEILEYSGFISIDRALVNLQIGREECQHAVETMKAFIIASMPTYDYEELDNYTLKKLTKLVAVSELILQIKSGIARGEDLSLSLTPEEVEEAHQQKTHKFNIEDLDKANRNIDGGTTIGAAPLTDPVAQRLHAALG